MLRSAPLVLVALLAALPASADRVKYLPEPKTAYAAFVSTIAAARSSIDLATFIFEPCEPSVQVLLETLAARARDGVRVRLLLDNVTQKSAPKNAMLAYLREAGAEIRFYNPYELNMRMHIKFLVVDGRRLVTGGRNLSDRYFAYSSELNYIDRDVLVEGAAAARAVDSFEELWTSWGAVRASASGSFAGWTRACGDVARRTDDVRADIRAVGPGLLAAVPERECADVEFVTDDPDFGDPSNGDPDHNGPYMTPMRLEKKRTSKAILEFLRGTRSKLEAENWVYLPLDLLSDELANLRRREVPVDIITNADLEDGPAFFREAMDYAVDVMASRHAVGSQTVNRISSRGAMTAAHDLTPAGARFFLHGKVFLRDGRDVAVGSFNLDSRSYSTNLESTVIVRDCPLLAADVHAPYARLQATYADDVRTNRVPPKKQPGFGAKLFAMMSLIFL